MSSRRGDPPHNATEPLSEMTDLSFFYSKCGTCQDKSGHFHCANCDERSDMLGHWNEAKEKFDCAKQPANRKVTPRQMQGYGCDLL